ncbi:MAG: NAD-dependent epimerase/dehydratase family protein [Pirellulaceae bacterium]
MDNLRIAVSGSSSLIGRALCERLVASGHAVSSVQRVSQSDCSDCWEAISWDPARGLLAPQQLSGTDCMIHLAGRSIASARWTPSEKQRIRDSRVRATRLLVDQICQLDMPPKTFISASATGIYGEHGAEEVDEATPRGHDFLADVASDWEDACLPLVQRGVRVVHPASAWCFRVTAVGWPRCCHFSAGCLADESVLASNTGAGWHCRMWFRLSRG